MEGSCEITHTSAIATKKWFNFLSHLECNKKMKSKQTHTQQRSTKPSIVLLELECVSVYVRGWVEFTFYMETKRTMTGWKSRRGCGEGQRTAALSHARLSNVQHVDLIATTAWTSWPELQCLLPQCKLFHRCSWISRRYITDYQWRHNSNRQPMSLQLYTLKNMERTCLFTIESELRNN